MKIIYQLTGALSLVFGLIGAFVPLLPTTCFVLLAAWCFARSSPAFYRRMRGSVLLGGIIGSWEQHRRIPAPAVRIAILSMLVSATVSLMLLPGLLLKAVLVILLLAGCVMVYRLRQTGAPLP
ncbi:YbaN family protein [Marinobacterium jannaschii]|uniref:YbaN family protein n=1 Tax=Marinobacterium jannaschii TaxID=64970 RepID=UPI0004887FDF|nr:YbaN family protein [Marinobacterium jannaschii]